MLPVAPLPFDDFGRAQIEGVLVSTKVFEKCVHLWAFYSGFAASWLLSVTRELHCETTSGQQSLIMMMMLLSDSVSISIY